MTLSRINNRFKKLKSENRAGLITFTTAGDPDYQTSLNILKGLPTSGADIIELGMPFSDPMADGPIIQAASIRALNHKMTLTKTLAMVAEFRKEDQDTPVILMGYYNPVYIYGVERFLRDASRAGIDGMIIVDLPPEEDRELAIPAKAAELAMIHLATPTTDDKRLERILENGTGFLYYVTIAGITGTVKPDLKMVEKILQNFRTKTNIPMAVGFGIKSAEDAADFAVFADAVVVGSAIVDIIADNIDQEGLANSMIESKVLSFVRELGIGVANARKLS